MKKMFLAILSMLLTLSLLVGSTVIPVTAAEEALCGDINGDGAVNSLDAALILKFDAGLASISAEQYSVGDVNTDGNLNSLDAAAVLRYDAGLISSLPVKPKVFETTAINNGAETVFKYRYEGEIDRLRIKTDPSNSYYLSYRTANISSTAYTPYASSLDNSTVGVNGLPITTVQIKVLDRQTNGEIKTGVVLFYRVKVKGAWFPWATNATAEWAYATQAKNKLCGSVDTAATCARGMFNGYSYGAIEGIEIHLFEESELYSAHSVSGKSKLVNTPYINQRVKYPTGCELISSVMALQFWGYQLTPETFIDNYVDKGNNKLFDPNLHFGGSPYRADGMGCYAPVIEKACNRYLADQGGKHKATAMYGKTLDYLCREYIDKGIPVVLHATIDMRRTWISRVMNYEGKLIPWAAPEHCLVLVGYDDEHYIFNDPWRTANAYYDKNDTLVAYLAEGAQSMVITPA